MVDLAQLVGATPGSPGEGKQGTLQHRLTQKTRGFLHWRLGHATEIQKDPQDGAFCAWG